jgi:GT2 family glycosyltransferase
LKTDATISFIIPHKGRFDMLKQTVESIVRQQYPADSVQVIIVSQTPEILSETSLQSLGKKLDIYTRPESDTISALRNVGTTHANGQFFAFLDADIYLSPNWISEMLALLQTPERIITSAMQVCEPDAPVLEKIRTQLSNAELDCEVNFLPGRNLFMRREAFQKIGGFPEHLLTCEDYYFTDQAAKLGSLYYSSTANYIHLGEDKIFAEMFKKEMWRGQSNLQSIAGRRIPLREIPSFVLPPGMLACVIAALLCLPFQAYTLAVALLIMAALPVVVYSLRLHRLAKSSLAFTSILAFYASYFPARAIGTVTGLFRAIGANHK